MLRRSVLLASIAIAQLAVPREARAQSSGLTLKTASADSARVDAGSVITTVFTVRNSGRDTIRAVPSRWFALMMT